MKAFLALAAALALVPPAAAAKEALRYSTTVAGIPLGKLKVFMETGPSAYDVGISFAMVPILRHVLDGDANADVTGAVVGGRYLPREMTFRLEDGDGDKRRTILFDAAGNPVDLRADPPMRERPYDMTLAEAAGAVDPATAAAVLMAPRADPCALSFDVFDGAKRHRVSLTGAASARRGDTVTCAGLYERIAGFKGKYMTPERRTWPFRATLAERDGRWVPLKITAATKFGPASATLR